MHRGWKKKIVLGISVLCLVAGLRAEDVYLIGSYHDIDPCGKPQYDAAVDALKTEGFGDLTFKGVYLDARHLSRDQITQKADEIRQAMRRDNPKLIFTIDDAAFALFYEEALAMPESYLVFTGLNRPLEYYNEQSPFLDKRKPIRNITGVYEYLFSLEQLEMLEAILDRPVNKVALLYSNDGVGVILKEQIEGELANSPYASKLISYPVETMTDLLSACREINDDPSIDAYFPITMSVYDETDNERKTMPVLAPILIENIKKIDLSLNSSFTKFGFFGGVSIDFYKMGFQTGFLATKLLKGIPAMDIPVENARQSVIAINKARMNELGITLSPDVQSIVDEWIE